MQFIRENDNFGQLIIYRALVKCWFRYQVGRLWLSPQQYLYRTAVSHYQYMKIDYLNDYSNPKDAYQHLSQHIHFSNHQRLYSSLDNLTPTNSMLNLQGRIHSHKPRGKRPTITNDNTSIPFSSILRNLIYYTR